MIEINLTLILTMLNFLVLVYLMRELLFKPFVKFLDKRSETIAESLRVAEENRIRAESIGKEQEIILGEARLKSSEIITKATNLSRIESQEILKAAKNQALASIDYAKKEIETEGLKAKNSLSKEVLSMAVLLADKVLEREIKEEDHAELLKKGFDTLGV